MIKKLAFIGFTGFSLMACGGNVAPVNTNTVANTNAANVANVNTTNVANTAIVATNKPANTAAKPAPSGPKRLNFSKGTSNTIEYFDLAPGEAKQFVVGAKSGQNLVVDNGGDGSQITLVTKGKTVDVTNEDGRIDATTTAGGDFVFEVKNTGKAKLKASVNVMIETIGDD